MIRFFAATSVFALLAACQMEGYYPDGTAKPRIDREGTCFLYVTAEPSGRFTLTSGVGDGSKTPNAMVKRGLSAKALDALWAKERRIMDVNPECLAIIAEDRSMARPAPELTAAKK